MRNRILCIFLLYIGISMAGLSHAELSQTERLLAEMATVEGDASLLQTAINSGKDRALLCGNCHGKNGNSVRDYIPNLASQNAAYLFNQFELFANGERKDYVMSRLAKNLTRQDRVNIALYYSQMSVSAREQPVPASAKGKEIYNGLCFTCHQQDGHGNGSYPRIAGQPYKYLESALKGFAGSNDRRANSPMAIIVANMSQQQLKDVASYIAAMP